MTTTVLHEEAIRTISPTGSRTGVEAEAGRTEEEETPASTTGITTATETSVGTAEDAASPLIEKYNSNDH